MRITGHAGELRAALRRIEIEQPGVERIVARFRGDRFKIETEGDEAPECTKPDW